MLSLASALLLVSGVLAALRRSALYAPLFVVVLVAPIFLVLGLSLMGDMPVTQAYAQATCAKGIEVCFPQAVSFLQSLASMAIAGGALLVYLVLRSR